VIIIVGPDSQLNTFILLWIQSKQQRKRYFWAVEFLLFLDLNGIVGIFVETSNNLLHLWKQVEVIYVNIYDLSSFSHLKP